MALADKKIANLTKEIKKLKDEQLQLLEATESYKNQVRLTCIMILFCTLNWLLFTK